MKLQTGKSTGFSFSLRQVGSPLKLNCGAYFLARIFYDKKSNFT